jgi:CubicO group peptidase (beta-lactamase class C family)
VLKRSAFHLILPLISIFAFSAEQSQPDIKATLQSFINAKDISGAVTVITTKDRILDVDAVGLADVERNKPMRADSLFWIASMTKPVTAVAVLMLQDEGKLKVTDPVEKYIPEFSALKTPSGLPAHLTLEQMLTHTSGLGEGDVAAIRNAHSLADVIPLYLNAPMQYEPGLRWKYTQSGINAAALVVEIVSGMPFDKFVQKRILKPLGMKNTTFFPNKKSRSRLVTPYTKDKASGLLVAAPPLTDFGVQGHPPFGNGGLFSTGPDYARFCQMLLGAGIFEGKQFLSPAAFKLLTTIHTGELETGFLQTPEYGSHGANYGWGVGVAILRMPHEGVASMLSPGTFGHGGAWGTQAWIDPVRGIAYILMIQRPGMNGDASEIRRAFQQSAFDAFAKK